MRGGEPGAPTALPDHEAQAMGHAQSILRALDKSMQRYMQVAHGAGDEANAAVGADHALHAAAAGRWVRLLQRRQTCRHLLPWLAHVESHTSRTATHAEVERLYREPLAWMATLGPRLLRTPAQRARAGLRHGTWTPRVQATHYDLRSHNILYMGEGAWDEPRVVAWRDARMVGHPYVDLLSLATSMHLSDGALSKAVLQACAHHADSIEAVGSYVSAAVGFIRLRHRRMSAHDFALLVSEAARTLRRLDPSLTVRKPATTVAGRMGQLELQPQPAGWYNTEVPPASPDVDTRW